MRKLEYQQGLLEEPPDGLDPLSLLGAAATGISRKAGGLLTELLTPNTSEAPTFLRGPERERNFKNWFGDSKVVDEAGNPLKLYHGTVSDFDAFDNAYLTEETPSPPSALGHFFTENPRVSNRFAGADLNSVIMNRAERHGRNLPVNLRLEKPFVLESNIKDNGTQNWLDKRYMDAYELLYEVGLGGWNKGVKPEPFSPEYYDKVKEAQKFRKLLQNHGHDGIILRNTLMDAEADTDPSDHYIIFDPNQAKGIYNRGTYSLEDDDLLGMLKRGKNTQTS